MDMFYSLVPPPFPHSVGDSLYFPLSTCCLPNGILHSTTPVITSGAQDAVRMQSSGIVCGWALGINNPSSWDSQDSCHEHPAQENFLLLSLMPPFSLALLIYYTESGEVTAKVSAWFEADMGFELMTKCQRQDCY